MKFKFKIQQYQTEAVENTVNVFAGQPAQHGLKGYRIDLANVLHYPRLLDGENSVTAYGEIVLTK